MRLVSLNPLDLESVLLKYFIQLMVPRSVESMSIDDHFTVTGIFEWQVVLG